MHFKKIKYILITILFYQIPFDSKSNSFEIIRSENLAKYFSGIVASENDNNSKALEFFNSSKILINNHDPYLKKYTYSLVLNDKIPTAINIIKRNKKKKNSDFFEANLLLIIDNLKKNNLDQAYVNSQKINTSSQQDGFEIAIITTLQQYIYVFKEKKIAKYKINKIFNKYVEDKNFLSKMYLENLKPENKVDNLVNLLSKSI